MPRKAPTSRKAVAEERVSIPRPAKAAAVAEPRLGGPDDLTRLALKACLIARDAAFNVRDLLTNNSRMAFLAIKDCEKELDLIERQIDERLPVAFQPEVNDRPGADWRPGDERGHAGACPHLENGGLRCAPVGGNVDGAARHARPGSSGVLHAGPGVRPQGFADG